MNDRWTAIAALCLAAACRPAAAQFPPGGGFPDGFGEFGGNRLYVDPAAQLKQLEMEFAHLVDEQKRMKMRYEAGQVTAQDLGDINTRVEQAKMQIDAVRGAVSRQQRLESLRVPVAADLRNASLRQAAEAMERVTNVPIAVEKTVPEGTRLNMVVQGVPLATVLEAVARQTELMIAPDPSRPRGIVLKPWPTLVINEQKMLQPGPTAPWSPEWGITPGSYASMSGMMPANPLQYANRPASAGRGGPEGAVLTPPQPHFTFMNERPGGRLDMGGVSVTTLGDKLIVAQPWTDPDGEPAVVLTVYRLEGSQLRKASTLIQRTDPTGRTRAQKGGKPNSLATPPAAPSPAAAPAVEPQPVPARR